MPRLILPSTQYKIAIAVPPNNDVDLYANDVGLIAIVDKNGDLAGFNVTAGGGMGVTHGNKKTYPRLGSMLGYIDKDKTIQVVEKIMLTQPAIKRLIEPADVAALALWLADEHAAMVTGASYTMDGGWTAR